MMLGAERPGPLIVTGEPGIGRTSVLGQALELLDGGRDAVIIVDVTNGRRPSVPQDFAAIDVITVPAATDAVRHAAAFALDGAGARRPVFVVDDAHLAGHAVVQLLRELH